MLTMALDEWKEMARKDRLLTEAPGPSEEGPWRGEGQPPEGGLVLELFVRDLPRKTGPMDARYADMWNHDFAWFTREEARSMIPDSRKPDDQHRVPENLVRRLARLHLLDSVRGINDAHPYEDKDIQKAEMFLRVDTLEGDLLRLKIEGATRAVEPPLRVVRPSRADEEERGYEAKLLGRATYDVKEEKFLSFELLAIGPRWGGRGYAHSMRQDDLAPQPMGFAVRMIPATEAGIRAVPLHVTEYFTGAVGSRDRMSTIRVAAAGQVVKAQIGANGTIHLLYDTEDGPQYSSSRDSGVTFSEPIPVVDSASRKPGLKFHGADLAVGKDGRVHVALSSNAWKLKLPEEEWSLFYACLASGAKAFSPLRNLNHKPSEGFSLAADDRGTVTATFLSGKLFAMVSRDNGETFTASEELNPVYDPCDCCTTSAAYGPDAKLALLYREETNNERDMYVVLWDQAHGNKPRRVRLSRLPWKTDSCPMTYFTIQRTETGYAAAWPTKGQVYFARLDQDGIVLPPGEIRTPGAAGMRTGLFAIGAADGATLVAWKKNDVLSWQLYDAKGQPEGKPGSAPSRGDGAAGVVLRDGRFALFP
jgi:hypothetical protein